jgi:hypothetical protein
MSWKQRGAHEDYQYLPPLGESYNILHGGWKIYKGTPNTMNKDLWRNRSSKTAIIGYRHGRPV